MDTMEGSGTPKIHLFHGIISLQGTANPKILNLFNLMKRSELFYEGVSLYGPYWDHVLGYWKASLEHSDKLMFLKYEEPVEDTVLYLKKTAKFMGYPFSPEEQQQGVPENIVQMCSFENLSGLEVNKTGKHCERQGNLGFENNIFFRKGKLGDWKNHLTIEMAQHLDQRTMQKLSGSSLSL
ncbi:flavonol 4'-sulfotransferase-like [Gossypium arboreum]|uniref:Sulfotransferase n=1 Tax=Gossypium arboreum TaxID=29729 RepID=A0ABR0Q5W5_GOSAR|nr:flavonol 4'-sulfotransferase-like [Gossypium arboreum]KAK5834442.1 hypothetical protein PVK06_018320 [Gossypium arboreum]